MAKKESSRLDLSKKTAQAIAAEMNAKYGIGTVVMGNKAFGLKLRVTSTGVYALDFALGGGFVRNRMTEVRGPFSSGKSTIAMKGSAEFQKASLDGLAVYVDFEHTFDPIYAARLGVDMDRLLIVSPDSGEQGVDAINDLLGIDKDIFMVGDSIAAMTPTAEITGSMDDQFMGLQARLINRMMRVATSRMKRSMYDDKVASTTVVWLNQLREKIGVMFGNPETTPGGKGKDFYYSTMFRLSNQTSKKIQKKESRHGIERQLLCGTVHDFSVNKNKAGGSQFDEGTFELFCRPHRHYKAGDVNNDEVALRMGLFYEVIEDTNRGWKLPTGEYLPKKPTLAIPKLYKLPKAMRIIRKRVLAAIREEAFGEE